MMLEYAALLPALILVSMIPASCDTCVDDTRLVHECLSIAVLSCNALLVFRRPQNTSQFCKIQARYFLAGVSGGADHMAPRPMREFEVLRHKIDCLSLSQSRGVQNLDEPHH